MMRSTYIRQIRCDATSENGPEACSSCKRTGARCQFSRQPMKRGPSKGYIKELADRLGNLESQIGTGAPPQNYDFGSVHDQVMSDAQAHSHFPRKRTHSMSENFADTYGRPNWAVQERGTYFTPCSVSSPTLTFREQPSNGVSPSNR